MHEDKYSDEMLPRFYDSYLSSDSSETLNSPAREALNKILSDSGNFLEVESLYVEVLSDESERAFKAGFKAAVAFLMGITHVGGLALHRPSKGR